MRVPNSNRSRGRAPLDKSQPARFKAQKAAVLLDRLPRKVLGKGLEAELRAERLATMGENA